MRDKFIMLMAAVMIAGPALAEPPTGSRLGEGKISGLQQKEEEAADMAFKMARCMVQKRSGMVRNYLRATSVDEAEAASSVLMAKGISCLSFVQTSMMSDTAIVSFPTDVLRGMLSEAALKDEAREVTALPALPLAKEYARPWFAVSSRDAVIDEMAACVADTNPGGVAALLATRAYTNEERTVFGALGPSLGPCLRVGAKLQANRQALRASLADALYQRLHAPVAPTGPATAAK
jgi:hypothetical protein